MKFVLLTLAIALGTLTAQAERIQPTLPEDDRTTSEFDYNAAPTPEQMRALDYCKISKRILAVGKAPMGSYIVTKSGHVKAVNTIELKKIYGQPGHIEMKPDFNPWNYWNLGEIEAVYAPCRH